MSSIARMLIAAESTTASTSIKMTMTSTNSNITATTCATSRIPVTSTTATAATNAKTRNTITSDPGILCFHHCNVKVFCFTLPHICPNCSTKLDTTGDDGDGSDDNKDSNRTNVNANDNVENKPNREKGIGRCNSNGITPSTGASILPFRLPYPFVRASQYPCAILLRPTTGDFLNDYNNATDLHIAVTTSTGTVVEFDRHGLRQHRAENMSEWWQCLLVGDVPEPWYDYWDNILSQLCKKSSCWSIGAYHEDAHNCYTFVLAFLQALGYEKLSEAAQSKTTFCEKYIVPRTTTAGKYISLYRKLRDAGDGLYVHPYASKRQLQQRLQGNKVRGYVKATPTFIVPAPAPATPSSITKNSTKPNNSNASSIKARSTKLCTIDE